MLTSLTAAGLAWLARRLAGAGRRSAPWQAPRRRESNSYAGVAACSPARRPRSLQPGANMHRSADSNPSEDVHCVGNDFRTRRWNKEPCVFPPSRLTFTHMKAGSKTNLCGFGWIPVSTSSTPPCCSWRHPVRRGVTSPFFPILYFPRGLGNSQIAALPALFLALKSFVAPAAPCTRRVVLPGGCGAVCVEPSLVRLFPAFQCLLERASGMWGALIWVSASPCICGARLTPRVLRCLFCRSCSVGGTSETNWAVDSRGEVFRWAQRWERSKESCEVRVAFCMMNRMLRAQSCSSAAPTAALAPPRHHCRSHCHVAPRI